jgi:hypothetical protein
MRWPTLLLAATAALIAGVAPAAAVPIRYTFTGVLALVAGVDALQLDGATLTLTIDLDTATPPFTTQTGPGIASATYPLNALSIPVAFSNRPGGAQDLIVGLMPTSLVGENFFPPRPFRDQWGLIPSSVILDGAELGLIGLYVTFVSQDFFPGSDPPPLPLFEPADVAEVHAFALEAAAGAPRYRAAGATATAERIPEPAATILAAAGLASAAFLRRRSRRPGAALTSG